MFQRRPSSIEIKQRRKIDYRNALDAQIGEQPSHHGTLRYRPAIGPNGATKACFGSRRQTDLPVPPNRTAANKIIAALEVPPLNDDSAYPPKYPDTRKVLTPLPDLIPSEDKMPIPPNKQPSTEIRAAIESKLIEDSPEKIQPIKTISLISANQPSQRVPPPQFHYNGTGPTDPGVKNIYQNENYNQPSINQPLYGMPYPQYPPYPPYIPYPPSEYFKPQKTQTVDTELTGALGRALQEMEINASRLNQPVHPASFQIPNFRQTHEDYTGLNHGLKSNTPSPLKTVKIQEIQTPRSRLYSQSCEQDEKEEKSLKRKEEYARQLRAQMAESEKKKDSEKEKWRLQDEKIMKEMENYDPWGKGGGGAPLKDKSGNVVSNLRQIRGQNELIELGRDSAIPDFSKDFNPDSDRPSSQLRSEMIATHARHGVTKITDIYEPKKKVDKSYR